MQISTYSSDLVYLRLPDEATNVSVEIYKGGELQTVPALTPEMQPDGRHGVMVPFSITNAQGELQVVWSFDLGVGDDAVTYTQDQYVQVITHYVDLEHAAQELDVSNSKAKELEQQARMVIEGFCKQSFGRFNDLAFKAVGTDTKRLYIGRRILKIKSLTKDNIDIMGALAPYKEGDYEISLAQRGSPYYDIKSDHWWTPPIFDARSVYQATGDFGWTYVPEPVATATTMLMHDYMQPEAKWHEVNARQVSTADWSLLYGSPPISTTGNANVDKILLPYRQGRIIAL